MVNNRNFIFTEDNHIARALSGGAASSLGSLLGGVFGGLGGNIFGMPEDRLTLQQAEYLRQQQSDLMGSSFFQQQMMGMLHPPADLLRSRMLAGVRPDGIVMTPIERLETQLARCSYETWIVAGDRSTFQEWRHDHA